MLILFCLITIVHFAQPLQLAQSNRIIKMTNIDNFVKKLLTIQIFCDKITTIINIFIPEKSFPREAFGKKLNKILHFYDF
jgi:hypothetical protein